MRILVLVAFFASLFFLPWYVPILLGILLIAYWEAHMSVIIGGVILDALFGTPIAVLGGFSFLYTTTFLFFALSSILLRRFLME